MSTDDQPPTRDERDRQHTQEVEDQQYEERQQQPKGATVVMTCFNQYGNESESDGFRVVKDSGGGGDEERNYRVRIMIADDEEVGQDERNRLEPGLQTECEEEGSRRDQRRTIDPGMSNGGVVVGFTGGGHNESGREGGQEGEGGIVDLEAPTGDEQHHNPFPSSRTEDESIGTQGGTATVLGLGSDDDDDHDSVVLLMLHSSSMKKSMSCVSASPPSKEHQEQAEGEHKRDDSQHCGITGNALVDLVLQFRCEYRHRCLNTNRSVGSTQNPSRVLEEGVSSISDIGTSKRINLSRSSPRCHQSHGEGPKNKGYGDMAEQRQEPQSENEMFEKSGPWTAIRNCMSKLEHANSLYPTLLQRVGGRQLSFLHVLFKYIPVPPLDVLETVVRVTESKALKIASVDGRLPLHYACRHGFRQAQSVIRLLVEAYPKSACVCDGQGRLPLHYLFRSNATPSSLHCGSRRTDSSGRYLKADDSSRSRFEPSTSSSTLGRDVRKSTATITTTDASCHNQHRRAQKERQHELPNPEVVRLLLVSRQHLTSTDADGLCPLEWFAKSCQRLRCSDDLGRDRAVTIIRVMFDSHMSAPPTMATSTTTAATTKLFHRQGGEKRVVHCSDEDEDDDYHDPEDTKTVKVEDICYTKALSCLQLLPDPLLKVALSQPKIRRVLNFKTSEPLFALSCFLDLGVQLFLIAKLLVVTGKIAQGTTPNSSFPQPEVKGHVVWVFLPIVYMLARWIAKLGSFHKANRTAKFLADMWNWLDLMNVILLLASAALLTYQPGNFASYRDLIVLTGGLQWLALLSLLRQLTVQFSVFVFGVLHICLQLVPFLITTFILLGAWGFMYYTINFDSDECAAADIETTDGRWDDHDLSLCTEFGSFLSVFADFVGGLDDEEFIVNRSTMVLTIAFAIVMVILQLNVLIAVVTDSYANVQNDGEIVFWQNRFYYIIALDHHRGLFTSCMPAFVKRGHGSMKSGMTIKWDVIRRGLKSSCGIGRYGSTHQHYGDEEFENDAAKDIFRRASVDERERNRWGRRNPCIRAVDALLYLTFMVIWLVLGLCTLGWLWPSQVREWLFCQSIGSEEKAECGLSPCCCTRRTHSSSVVITIAESNANAAEGMDLESHGVAGDLAIQPHCELTWGTLNELSRDMAEMKRDIGDLGTIHERLDDVMKLLSVVASSSRAKVESNG